MFHNPLRLAGISIKIMTDREVRLLALHGAFNPATITVNKKRFPFSAVCTCVKKGKKRMKIRHNFNKNVANKATSTLLMDITITYTEETT